MPDKDQKNIYDEEYHLPEEEYIAPEVDDTHPEGVYGEEVSEASAPSRSPFAKVFSHLPQTRNMRIVLAIGVVVLVFVIFHFLHADQGTVIPKPAPQPVQATAPQPAPVVQQPLQTTQPNNNALDSLNALQSSHSETVQKLNDMQSQITDLQNALSQSQTTNQQLQNALTTLTGQVSTLSTKLNSLIAGLSEKPAHGFRLIYHIRAVLPDRAWLVSNTGEALTVTIGNRLKEYGIVRGIDPERGIIDTSSGRKIYYGSNDF